MIDSCSSDLKTTLQTLADPAYLAFHSKLIPNVPREKILGIRTPVLRKFAREFGKTPAAKSFLARLPHFYYEENNLHAFLLEQEKDLEKALTETERFLPFVDNWATCDCFAPPVFRRDPSRIHQKATEWLQSQKTYTIRYGIVTMMRYDLDGEYRDDALAQAAAVQSEEYYVNMAVAWFFSAALAKQYTAVLPYLQNHLLSPRVHQKTIQKARESLRLSSEQKQELASLRLLSRSKISASSATD